MTAFHTSLRALARLILRYGTRINESRSSGQPPSGGHEPGDRERLTQRILSTIHNNSILLCGKAGSGKTLMLLHLRELLSTAGDPTTAFYPVYVDLHNVPERLLFATLAGAVSSQLNSSAPPGPRVFGAECGHRDLANLLRHVIRILKKRRCVETRLVLLVDGIDQLNNYAPRTTQRLRSLFMASLDGSLVMVASAVAIDKHWEEEGSPWYNFFEEIQLRPPVHDGAHFSLPG